MKRGIIRWSVLNLGQAWTCFIYFDKKYAGDGFPRVLQHLPWLWRRRWVCFPSWWLTLPALRSERLWMFSFGLSCRCMLAPPPCWVPNAGTDAVSTHRLKFCCFWWLSAGSQHGSAGRCSAPPEPNAWLLPTWHKKKRMSVEPLLWSLTLLHLLHVLVLRLDQRDLKLL